MPAKTTTSNTPGKAGGKKGLTHARRRVRDAHIMHLLASGKKTTYIAQQVGLTKTQIDNIIKREKEDGVRDAIMRQTPQDVVLDALAEQHRSIEMYSLLAMEAEKDADVIAALRAKDQGIRMLLKTYGQLGFLPRWLGHLRTTLDFAGIAREMSNRLEAVERGEQDLSFALDYFHGLTKLGRPDGPPINAAGLPVIEGKASDG